jgi:serine/threonine protein kinase
MTQASHPQPGAQSQRPQGTTHWMAPEIFGLKPNYSFASDIYAFAMVVWEIMSRQLPYKDAKDLGQIIFAVNKGDREDIPAEAPTVLKETTAACWAQAPEKRPLAGQVLEWLSA